MMITRQDVIDIANEIYLDDCIWVDDSDSKPINDLVKFAKLVAAKERDALEAELLKLKNGVAANSDYIQGRWDLIGEFQDVIRKRGEA